MARNRWRDRRRRAGAAAGPSARRRVSQGPPQVDPGRPRCSRVVSRGRWPSCRRGSRRIASCRTASAPASRSGCTTTSCSSSRTTTWSAATPSGCPTTRSSGRRSSTPEVARRRAPEARQEPAGRDHICAEAEGPVLFAGWAGEDDGYACADHGCGCGWEYAYDLGEPMGMAWPTPLIQITAYSEDQTDNTYDVLRPMIEKGPLADLIPKTGETFIRLRGADDQARIEIVTSSEQSRLGARATASSRTSSSSTGGNRTACRRSPTPSTGTSPGPAAARLSPRQRLGSDASRVAQREFERESTSTARRRVAPVDRLRRRAARLRRPRAAPARLEVVYPATSGARAAATPTSNSIDPRPSGSSPTTRPRRAVTTATRSSRARARPSTSRLAQRAGSSARRSCRAGRSSRSASTARSAGTTSR
jgi:hypothetical protein